MRTLRSKLILTYSAVAVLCLILALTVTFALARQYVLRQGFKSLEEKRALAVPLLRLLVTTESRPAAPRVQQLVDNLQENIRQSNTRMLFVDPTTFSVVLDTSARYSAVGQRMRFDVAGDEVTRRVATAAGLQGTYRFDGEAERVQYIAQRVQIPRQLLPEARAGNAQPPGLDQAPFYIVVLAQPEPRLAGLPVDLRDALVPAIIVALAVSLLFAVVLARSISRPVIRLAGAAGAIAKGDYSQRIPVAGRDELATLTARFNEMAAEVEHAHKMQRDFVANVSHDLKTPLTSIQGFSQAMLDGAIKDEAGYKQAGEIINSEAQRMSRLVNELLTLARLENGLTALEMRPVSLPELAQRQVLTMQPQAVASGVLVVARMLGPGSPVLADADRLAQALGNIIDNALKHTPRGGEVVVEVSEVEAGMQIAVRDNGRGIPPDDLQRVMERFYQIDKARPGERNESVGLGLAIAREIVRAHHGDITLTSLPGQGTTVTVVMPSERSAAEQGRRKLRV